MEKVLLHPIGETDYSKAWNFQEEIFQKLVDAKVQARKNPESYDHHNRLHHLISCTHPHVYTLGKSGKESHLLADEKLLTEKGASFYKINRGGDITYHGPGQLVLYPILDLECFFTDIHKYLRLLEESIILTLAEYQIKAERYPGYTGVWLDANDPDKARKICAMGVRCSRWVTMHGLAFNISPNLDYFKLIVPCGIDDKQVTSMERELGYKPDFKHVEEKVIRHFARLFSCEIILSEKEILMHP
jgi:lipoyl(octanoyl) transferase